MHAMQQVSCPALPHRQPVLPLAAEDGGTGSRSFLLTKEHRDVLGQHFAAMWARGAAGVLQRRPSLFFQPDGLFDFLAVREAGCPAFACSPCSGRPGCCGCLNPWAARGGNPCHDACGHAHDPAVAVPEGGGRCRLRGVAYAPGDLAWLVPPAARHRDWQPPVADAQLELVRGVWWRFWPGMRGVVQHPICLALG